jgi:membrane protein DedA with SNARE-associated domain
MHTILIIIIRYSYWGIFAAIGLGVLGLPIPDEMIIAYVGFLIFKGKINLFLAFFAAYAGTTCGITISYLLGRFYGHRFLEKYADKIHLNPDRVRSALAIYNRYGKFALVIGYFIPGVRHLTAIFAGTSLISYRTFALFAYIGGFIWVIAFISLGYFLGEEWHHFSRYAYHYIVPIVLVASIILILVLYLRSSNENTKTR